MQVLNSLAELECTSLQVYNAMPTWAPHPMRLELPVTSTPKALGTGTLWLICWQQSQNRNWFKKRIKKLQAQVDFSKAVMIKGRSGRGCFEYLWEASNWSKWTLLKANGTQSCISLVQLCNIFLNVFWLRTSLQQFELSLLWSEIKAEVWMPKNIILAVAEVIKTLKATSPLWWCPHRGLH